jgi:hypothetical protein
VSLLFLTACVDFNILNQAEVRARVLIQTPDGGRYTKAVEPFGSANSFSEHGGSYTISILPDEQYQQLLRTLREEISKRLFEDRNSLSAEDVSRLVNNLNQIQAEIEKAADQGASCSGSAPDFSSVNAVIGWSDFEADWSITCAVVGDEE